jgi:hypothetical protein
MTEHEEIHLDIDPMLFYATVIEDDLAILDMLDMAPGLFDGMAEIGHEKLAEAQTALDALIEADKTWRPA